MRIIPGRIETLFFKTLTRISPALNTKVYYFRKFGKKPNLNNPETFNEKVLKLKLEDYNNNPIVKQCSDKYRVRDFVKNIGCGELLVPLIATYDSPNEIDWESLPDRFAMKWNFGCGFNIVCNDKSKLNKKNVIDQMLKWGGVDYYLSHSEMQYKDVEKKILVEEFLDAGKEKLLPEDYKFYCMNGKCKTVLVCKDRVIGEKAKYFFMSPKWSLYPYSKEAIENPKEEIPKPNCINTAIEYAEKLSTTFPFVRVDLYIIGEKIYFGELTFTPAAGMDTDLIIFPPNSDENVDMIFGKWLDISHLNTGRCQEK